MENEILVYITLLLSLGSLMMSISKYFKNTEQHQTTKEYKTPFYLGDDGKLHRNTKYTD